MFRVEGLSMIVLKIVSKYARLSLILLMQGGQNLEKCADVIRELSLTIIDFKPLICSLDSLNFMMFASISKNLKHLNDLRCSFHSSKI